MTAPAVLLLARGRLDGVRDWARRGLLPVWVVPDVAWTLVLPAGPAACQPPYDDPVSLLGGRPLPARLRPSLCFVVDGPRAVVTVHQSSRRAAPRWLVWSQDVGLTRVDGLPAAPLGLVGALAGVRGEQPAALRSAVRADGRTGADVVDDLLRALRLPGAGLPLGAAAPGDLPGAVRVTPDERAVARFDAFVAHEAELAAQLGGGR